MPAIILFLLLLFASPSWAATLYVDATPGSNCSGDYSIASRNCSGSDGNSYTTLAAAYTASSASDTINVRSGTYTYTSTLTLAKASQVWQKYASDATNPIRDGQGTYPTSHSAQSVVLNAASITWDGIDVIRSNGTGLSVGYNADSSIIKNCKIHDSWSHNLTVGQSDNVLIQNVEAYEADLCMKPPLGATNCPDGYQPSNVNLKTSSNIIIENSSIHDSWGDGLIFDKQCDAGIVRYSTIYNNKLENVYFCGSKNCQFYSNLVYQDVVNTAKWKTSTYPGQNIVIGEEYHEVAYQGGHKIYGNLVTGGFKNLVFWQGTLTVPGVEIYNNTFIEAFASGSTPINIDCNSSYASGWVFKNNIVQQTSGTVAAVPSGWTKGYNLFSRPSGSVDSDLQGTGDVYSTTPQFATTTVWSSVTAGSLTGAEFVPLPGGNLVDKVAGIASYTTLPLSGSTWPSSVSTGDATAEIKPTTPTPTCAAAPNPLSTTPTFVASAFAETATGTDVDFGAIQLNMSGSQTHAYWQVCSDSGCTSYVSTTPATNVDDATNKTQLELTAALDPGVTRWWRVRYKDNAYSPYSTACEFYAEPGQSPTGSGGAVLSAPGAGKGGATLTAPGAGKGGATLVGPP